MAGAEEEAARLALGSLPRAAPQQRLHLLPCAVQHDGAAAVQRYFEPAVREQREPGAPHEFAVSFRGRGLKGKEVLIPEGYLGLVLEKEVVPFLSLEERKVRIKSAFEALTVWNLEQAPNSGDEIFMALSWPKVAEGIHSPVSEEE